MRSPLFLIILCSYALLMCFAFGSSDTYSTTFRVVPPQSINAAIAAATPGDTVLIIGKTLRGLNGERVTSWASTVKMRKQWLQKPWNTSLPADEVCRGTHKIPVKIPRAKP